MFIWLLLQESLWDFLTSLSPAPCSVLTHGRHSVHTFWNEWMSETNYFFYNTQITPTSFVCVFMVYPGDAFRLYKKSWVQISVLPLLSDILEEIYVTL